jgi:hypothetical protein
VVQRDVMPLVGCVFSSSSRAVSDILCIRERAAVLFSDFAVVVHHRDNSQSCSTLSVLLRGVGCVFVWSSGVRTTRCRTHAGWRQTRGTDCNTASVTV